MNHLLKITGSLLIFVWAILTGSFKSAQGQSDYYWAQNFNTESALLAGAVVGGNAGPSAIFYNPALINQDESHKFALSANLISFQSMELDNIAGENTDFNKFIFQVQPKFISYAGAPSKNPKWTYEFAFLVPLTRNIKFTYLFYDELDIIKRLDGPEDYIGEIVYRNQYDDYYVGGGLSYELSDRFSIGFSLFVSIKVLEYRSTLATKAMQETDTVYSNGIPEPFYFAQNTYAEQMKYWDISLVTKFGVQYRSLNGNWGVGLNMTFPNLSIYGEGKVKKEFYRSNVFDNYSGEFSSDFAFSGYQEKLRTKVKDPFSIAVGVRYNTPNRKNAIMLTSEYFLAIDPYSMLKTTDSKVVGNLQVGSVAEAMTFYTSARAVLNLGLGFVQYINERLTINGGFKTDFNTLTGMDQKDVVNPWYHPLMNDLYFDKFHIIAGPRLDVKRFGIVLGIQYTWGRQKDLYNIANFSDPFEYIPETNQALQGVRQKNMNVIYNEISLFFGVTYGFGQSAN